MPFTTIGSNFGDLKEYRKDFKSIRSFAISPGFVLQKGGFKKNQMKSVVLEDSCSEVASSLKQLRMPPKYRFPQK